MRSLSKPRRNELRAFLLVMAFLLAPTTLAFTSSTQPTHAAQGPLKGRNTPIVFSTKPRIKILEQEPAIQTNKPKHTVIPKKAFRRPRSIALIPLDDDNDVTKVHAVVDVAEAGVELTVAVDKARKELVDDSKSIESDSVEPVVEKMLVKSVVSVANGVAVDNELSVKEGSAMPVIYSTDTLAVSEIALKMLNGSAERVPHYDNPMDQVDQKELAIVMARASDGEKGKNKLDLPVSTSEVIPTEVASVKEDVVESAAVADEKVEQRTAYFTNPLEKLPPTVVLPKKERDANLICAQAFAAVDEHPILLFDGACNLCNEWVNFCLDYDLESTFRFASLQSKVGQSILIRDGRPPDDRSDIILATPQETYAKSDAVLRVISQLEGLPPLVRVTASMARIFFPSWFLDAAYKFLSANRHIFGDTDGPVCRLDFDGEYQIRFIEDPDLDKYDENLASESEAEVFVTRLR